MVLANVDQNTMSTSKEGACSKRNAQPSRIDELAAGVRNENDDAEVNLLTSLCGMRAYRKVKHKVHQFDHNDIVQHICVLL